MSPVDDDLKRLLDIARTGTADRPDAQPLTSPRFAIDAIDLAELFDGLDHELIRFTDEARFDVRHRPRPDGTGRSGLLSFWKDQTTINGEYLPQLAGYVHLIRTLGYHPNRVLFEPGEHALRVDLAVLDDESHITILAEVKVAPGHPRDLHDRIVDHYSTTLPPEPAPAPNRTKEKEAWQVAERLWRIRPKYLWLTAPGERLAFACHHDPLTLDPIDELPMASTLGLDFDPGRPLESVDYRRR